MSDEQKDREHYEIAKEAYTLWRGSHNHSFMPAEWNDLSEGWRESYCKVVAHALAGMREPTEAMIEAAKAKAWAMDLPLRKEEVRALLDAALAYLAPPTD